MELFKIWIHNYIYEIVGIKNKQVYQIWVFVSNFIVKLGNGQVKLPSERHFQNISSY